MMRSNCVGGLGGRWVNGWRACIGLARAVDVDLRVGEGVIIPSVTCGIYGVDSVVDVTFDDMH